MYRQRSDVPGILLLRWITRRNSTQVVPYMGFKRKGLVYAFLGFPLRGRLGGGIPYKGSGEGLGGVVPQNSKNTQKRDCQSNPFSLSYIYLKTTWVRLFSSVVNNICYYVINNSYECHSLIYSVCC